MRQWEAWDCSREKVFKVFCYVISFKRSLFAAQSFSYDSLVMCVCQKLVQALIFLNQQFEKNKNRVPLSVLLQKL